MTEQIINVSNLVKIYPDGTKAVDDVSFSVSEGEFFGFLGPNGAGKTTTIKILTTLLKKTSGDVSIFGNGVGNDSRQIRKMIGVQAQETAVDEDMTGRENMMLQGRFHRMKANEIKKRVDELVDLFGLAEIADRRALYYSGGMKKRLDLAAVLVHRPKLLYLDEPTTGLDPQSRAAIWSYLEKINKEEGVTVFLTTQYMEEADRLCDRLAIIDYGKIAAEGSPNSLKREIGGDIISVELQLNNPSSSEDLQTQKEKAASALQGLPQVSRIIPIEKGLSLYVKEGSTLIPQIVRALDEVQIGIASLKMATPTLDDVFLKYTGRQIRPEELLKTAPRSRMFRRR
jgi:daunorubicin resistance ABC transporter ATP-binding subunit